jgi:hypothetical protein
LCLLFPTCHSPSYGLYAKHPTPCSPYRDWGAKCLILGIEITIRNDLLNGIS